MFRFGLSLGRSLVDPLHLLHVFLGALLGFGVVGLSTVAGNTFPVPPGRHEWASEFEIPVSGHLLIAGGRLHDYGESVRVEEVATGKRILSIEARRDSSGHLLSMPRKLLALRGDGLRLVAGRRYRIVAAYENPTTDTIPGAMGIIGGLFAPDDLRRWPAIDPTNAVYRLDLELLRNSAIARRAGPATQR